MVGERYREVFAQQLDLTVPEHQLAHPGVIRSLFDLRALPDSLVSPGMRQFMQSNRTIPSDSTAIRNLRVLHAAGVPIVAGTDAGNIGTPHGPALHREIELMRAAGLSPREILTTATVGGARLAGHDDRGIIEAGHRADLVVLDADPRTDIKHWSTIYRVVKDGRAFTPEELVEVTPAHAVQRHVNAYNARDLEGFLSTLADSVALYDFPGTFRQQGKAWARANYQELFGIAPNLHVEITNRMVQGRTVVDKERITGLPGRDMPYEAIAIYRINEESLVERVDLIEE